jgi:hypothetical protein
VELPDSGGWLGGWGEEGGGREAQTGKSANRKTTMTSAVYIYILYVCVCIYILYVCVCVYIYIYIYIHTPRLMQQLRTGRFAANRN